jgi:glutathione S-transferase
MTERPQLYSFRRCPYAMRARMAVAVAEVPVVLREIVLRDKPEAMLALSPKGTVPVLHLPGGDVIDESRAVMDWALAQNDPLNWRQHKDDALIDLFDTDFKHHLDRYKYATRYPEEAVDATEQRAHCVRLLAPLEARLTEAWLGGAAPAYTDVALLPFVRQFRIADIAWFDAQLDLANVRDWALRFLDWPGFVRVMQKYPLYLDGEQEHAFPPPTEAPPT